MLNGFEWRKQNATNQTSVKCDEDVLSIFTQQQYNKTRGCRLKDSTPSYYTGMNNNKNETKGIKLKR